MLQTTEQFFKMMDDVVEEVGEENMIQIVTTMQQIKRQLDNC